MPVVQSIRSRNKFFIPAIISSLVAPDQQDRTALRVQGKEHSIGPPRMSYPKFFQIRMTRQVNEVSMGMWECRAHFLKQDHLGVHVHLFSFAQPFPPAWKTRLCIQPPIPWKEYSLEAMFCQGRGDTGHGANSLERWVTRTRTRRSGTCICPKGIWKMRRRKSSVSGRAGGPL